MAWALQFSQFNLTILSNLTILALFTLAEFFQGFQLINDLKSYRPFFYYPFFFLQSSKHVVLIMKKVLSIHNIHSV